MATASDDGNYHPWKRTAWEARQAVSEALVALPDRYSPLQSVAVHQYHEVAQTYLFEYFSVFEPKKDRFGGDIDLKNATQSDWKESLWWEPLMSIGVPTTGAVRLKHDADVLRNGSTDTQVLSVVGSNLPKNQEWLCLGTLRRLFQTENTFQIEVRGFVPNQGTETRTIEEPYYLPVRGIVAVRGQLDRCLEEAGWLPTFNKGDIETWSFDTVEDGGDVGED